MALGSPRSGAQAADLLVPTQFGAATEPVTKRSRGSNTRISAAFATVGTARETARSSFLPRPTRHVTKLEHRPDRTRKPQIAQPCDLAAPPVRYEERSPAREQMTSATSVGVPRRRIGSGRSSAARRPPARWRSTGCRPPPAATGQPRFGDHVRREGGFQWRLVGGLHPPRHNTFAATAPSSSIPSESVWASGGGSGSRRRITRLRSRATRWCSSRSSCCWPRAARWETRSSASTWRSAATGRRPSGSTARASSPARGPMAS
jgi:hypothetical protein